LLGGGPRREQPREKGLRAIESLGSAAARGAQSVRATRLDNPSAKATTEAGLVFEVILKIGGEDGTATQVSLREICGGKVDDVALLGLGLSESKEVLTRLRARS
jgi:hypothetical protein